MTAAGDVLVYSHSGTFLGHLPIQYLLQSYTAFTTGKEPSDTVAAYVPAPGTPGNPKVLDVEWFSGATNSVDLATPALAITLDTQQILLLRHIEDNSPVVINTHFDQIIRTKWNHDCTTLVVAGYRWRNKVPGGNPTTSSINATGGRIWELCFYSPFGQYLGHLVIPGNGTVTDITWENDGTRIAVSSDIGFLGYYGDFSLPFLCGFHSIYTHQYPSFSRSSRWMAISFLPQFALHTNGSLSRTQLYLPRTRRTRTDTLSCSGTRRAIQSMY